MSNRGVGVSQSRRSAKLLQATALIFYAIFVCSILVVLSLFFVSLRSNSTTITESAIGIISLIASMVGYVAGVGFWVRGERHLTLSASDVLREDVRPPILYFRAFSDEPRTTRRFGRSQEERLCAEIWKVGPFVAVGRPGDRLPPRGAKRLYVDDDDWQRVVSHLLDVAAGVVIRLGRGEGLSWEIQQTVLRVLPERVVFIMPQGLEDYGVYKARLDPFLPRPLPPYAPHHMRSAYRTAPRHTYETGGFLHFAPDWSPHIEFMGHDPSPVTIRRAVSDMLSPEHRVLRKEFSRCLGPFTFRLMQSQRSARGLSRASDVAGSRPGKKTGSGVPTVAVPAGWYPDPAGRHELRWFDTGWRSWVSDWGVVTEDQPVRDTGDRELSPP